MIFLTNRMSIKNLEKSLSICNVTFAILLYLLRYFENKEAKNNFCVVDSFS